MTNVVTDLLGARVTVVRYDREVRKHSYPGIVRAIAHSDHFTMLIEYENKGVKHLSTVTLGNGCTIEIPAESTAPTDTEPGPGQYAPQAAK